MTPGFFDVFFRPAEPEPEPSKPKKAKKVKKEHETPKSLKEENAWLLSEVSRLTPESEPEPVIEAEEPEDDESS